MTKSELITKMTQALRELPEEAVHQAVNVIIVQISDAIASGQGVEIRGFGSFSLRYRSPRIVRNPNTQEKITKSGSHAIHFKPGKLLRERVNNRGITFSRQSLKKAT